MISPGSTEATVDFELALERFDAALPSAGDMQVYRARQALMQEARRLARSFAERLDALEAVHQGEISK